MLSKSKMSGKWKLLFGLSIFCGVMVFIGNYSSKVDQKEALRKVHTVPHEKIVEEVVVEKENTSKGYKPTLKLNQFQTEYCLAILAYSEYRHGTRGNMEAVIWSAINRYEHPRKIHGKSVCDVIRKGKGSQFNGVTPYLKVLSDYVWGRSRPYIPDSARKSKIDMEAWKLAKTLANEILSGKLPRMHKATHFISFKGMKGNTFPNWLRYLKPVSVQFGGDHIYFTDNTKIGDKNIYFTKENGYDSKKHDIEED